jgi:hypothetical protein
MKARRISVKLNCYLCRKRTVLVSLQLVYTFVLQPQKLIKSVEQWRKDRGPPILPLARLLVNLPVRWREGFGWILRLSQ